MKCILQWARVYRIKFLFVLSQTHALEIVVCLKLILVSEHDEYTFWYYVFPTGGVEVS